MKMSRSMFLFLFRSCLRANQVRPGSQVRPRADGESDSRATEDIDVYCYDSPTFFLGVLCYPLPSVPLLSSQLLFLPVDVAIRRGHRVPRFDKLKLFTTSQGLAAGCRCQEFFNGFLAVKA